MAAKFFTDVSEEERDAWRQSSVTIAALAMLKEHQESALHDVLSNTGSTPDGDVKYDLGFHAGVSSALDLLENDE